MRRTLSGCCAGAASGHAAAALAENAEKFPPPHVHPSIRALKPYHVLGPCLVHYSKIEQRMTGVGQTEKNST